MFARHFIDSLDFVRNGREVRGEVAVADLPRLQDMLADPEACPELVEVACPEDTRRGKVSYLIRGFLDKSGKPMLEVAINGLCQLICQRCLSGLAYPVNLVSQLMLVQEGGLDEFSTRVEEDEPDSVPADDHLDVIALLEEEILLSLPFAPKHPAGACQLVTKGLDQSGISAFAVLAGLKDK